MTDNNFNPSTCRINKAYLYSFDGSRVNIIDFITDVTIYQSIESVSFRGSISLLETVGLLEGKPLRGEERLELELESDDIGTRKRLNLHVYKIDNVTVKDGNDGMSYILHFVSKISYEASKRRIIEPFETSANVIARTIFSKYFQRITPASITRVLPYATREFTIDGTNERLSVYIQPTEGIIKCIIPNYIPTEAMYFVASRSFSTESESCTFRFFETLDDYFFVTDEFLIKNAIETDSVINLTYNQVTSKNPKDIEQQINNIEVLENVNRVDTSKDIFSGGYTNKVIDVDFVRKIVTQDLFDYADRPGYVDMNGDTSTARGYVHTEGFIRETFTEENARRFMLFRDYGQVGDTPGPLQPEQFISESVKNRVAYLHHLNNTVVNVSMKGRLDIKPGDIVKINSLEFINADKRRKNPQLSGNFLVHSTQHSINGEQLNLNMKLTKYDWSV